MNCRMSLCYGLILPLGSSIWYLPQEHYTLQKAVLQDLKEMQAKSNSLPSRVKPVYSASEDREYA